MPCWKIRASHPLSIFLSLFVAMKEKLRFAPGALGFVNHVTAPLGQLASHRHEELEVNLVVSGKAAYLFGQERAPLVPGSMIWLFPGQEHVLIDSSHDLSLWVLVFKPELVRQHSSMEARESLRLTDPGAILCRQLDVREVSSLHPIFL